MRLLTKIFGNRDDPETAASGGSEEGSPERQTIELEPYELSAGDEPRATSEQSGRVTFAPPAGDSPSPEPAAPSGSGQSGAAPSGSGRSSGEGRRKRRRPTGAEGSDEQPHELTRRRIARPTASTVDLPPTPPPIPVNTSAADDPEEIDVSDQLDDMNDAEADLDASIDLIIEDDEPSDEDEEETNTSVSVWGAAATGPSPASSPVASEPATSEPLGAESPAAGPPADASPAAPAPEPEDAADGSGSISPNATQPDPEWTRMPTETKRPKQTLVEAGTEFTGTVKSSCPVIVHGTLDGEIEAPSLSIATTGTVHGNIRAESLRSYGTLAGTVDAGEVYVSGVVRSKTVIRARRLELQLGSSSKSQIELTVKTSNGELSALPSSPEASSIPNNSIPSSSVASSGVPNIAPSSSPTNSAPSEATTSSEGEASGSAGWDLPEAESGIEPVRARGKRTTAK